MIITPPALGFPLQWPCFQRCCKMSVGSAQGEQYEPTCLYIEELKAHTSVCSCAWLLLALLPVCCSWNQLMISFRNRKLGLISIFPGDWSLDQLPPQKSWCCKSSYKNLYILDFWEIKQTSYSEGRYSTPWSPLMKVTFQAFFNIQIFFSYYYLVLFTFVQQCSFSVKAS